MNDTCRCTPTSAVTTHTTNCASSYNISFLLYHTHLRSLGFSFLVFTGVISRPSTGQCWVFRQLAPPSRAAAFFSGGHARMGYRMRLHYILYAIASPLGFTWLVAEDAISA